jgi:hypothetical protein
MIRHGMKFLNSFEEFYIKYSSTISLNKNLILSGTFGFITSLFVAYISTIFSISNFANSILTVTTGFIISKILFIIFFHHDNKKKYTKKLTGKLNFRILKQILLKMILANSVFDIVNNLSRFFILFELLRTHYNPIQGAVLSSIISSSFSYLAINLIVKYINVFDSAKKKIF